MVPYNATATTVEAWINTTSTNLEEEIAGWVETVAQKSVELRVENGKLQFGVWDGVLWQNVTSIASVNTGVWTHVAGVKNGNNLSIYINATSRITVLQRKILF